MNKWTQDDEFEMEAQIIPKIKKNKSERRDQAYNATADRITSTYMNKKTKSIIKKDTLVVPKDDKPKDQKQNWNSMLG